MDLLGRGALGGMRAEFSTSAPEPTRVHIVLRHRADASHRDPAEDGIISFNEMHSRIEFILLCAFVHL